MSDRPPPLPDISIRQLEYLVAVADAPSWKSAAERSGVSPSALSQGLAELERRVGVPLFEPEGRRRTLRVAARPVLDHARTVVTATADLVRWSHRVRAGVSGRARVGMIDVAAVVHFPEVLGTFRSEHPGVELTLTVAPSKSLLTELRDGRIDIAVCVDPPTPPAGIERQPLLDEPLVVFGPPDTTVGDPSTWGPWLLFPAESHTRRAVDRALTALGAPIDVAAESHQPDVLREMVVLGLGWTVLPRSQSEGPDATLAAGPELVRRKLVIARRQGALVDPVVDELAGLLTASVSAA